MAFQKVKEAKPIDIVKKGYDIVKDELKGNTVKRKHLEYAPPTTGPSIKTEKSTRTDIVVLPSKQSKWGKKWDTIMEKVTTWFWVFICVTSRVKSLFPSHYPPRCSSFPSFQMRGHPLYKRVRGISEPVVTKSQEVLDL